MEHCGDYYCLNAVTQADRYLLTCLHDFMANLAGQSIFPKLNQVHAYHHVPIEKYDVHRYNAIRFIRISHYVFLMRNAMQIFQRVINEILDSLDFVFAYINDILIMSYDETEH